MPYDPKTILELERLFEAQKVHRPLRVHRFEPGTVLEYEVRGIWPDGRALVKLEIEKYVGGGYAGQVYKVRIVENRPIEGEIPGLAPGSIRAMKILVPASGFSRRIRNAFYFLGFQGPFSLQTNAAAGRSQALWQKFIRRAAGAEFGAKTRSWTSSGRSATAAWGATARSANGSTAAIGGSKSTTISTPAGLGSPGRPATRIGSPEYRSKREFMARIVRLLREMGAVELARQYEWWSLKSQPNALKRTASDPDPKAGLVAVDFRAGMALTPVNPQCPGRLQADRPRDRPRPARPVRQGRREEARGVRERPLRRIRRPSAGPRRA